MNDRFIPIFPPPGIYQNGTKYQSKGRWFDGNLVRFYEGIVGPIGGWRQVLDDTATPAPLSVAANPRMALGWKSNDEISFMAVGSTTKLQRYSDGAIEDITPVGLVVGNVDGKYTAGGYGEGPYGMGNYGTGTGAVTLIPADTWQLDNFGEDLIACYTADGRLFIALFDGNPASPITGAPISNNGVVVTPERFLVALGAGGDGRTVQWASQESTTDWVATDTNSAGQFELATKGRLLGGRRGRLQTMLWTDVDVYTMTFVAGNAVYSFQQVGDNCGVISPNGMITIGDVSYWMGREGKFFKYDGALQPIKCDLIDFLRQDMNQEQQSKVVAVPNTLFDEVIWFYPGVGQVGTENDRYIAYNYVDGTWTKGLLGRGAAIDRGVFDRPVYVDALGGLWEHEYGDGRTGAGLPFIESGPIELIDADIMKQWSGTQSLMKVNRYIPDAHTLGETRMFFYKALFPTDAETLVGPINAAQPTSLRFQSRIVRLRIEEVTQSAWRVGVPRLGVTAGDMR